MVLSLVLVLEYCLWYTANILTKPVFNAISIGGGLVTAVLLCKKRGDIENYIDYPPIRYLNLSEAYEAFEGVY